MSARAGLAELGRGRPPGGEYRGGSPKGGPLDPARGMAPSLLLGDPGGRVSVTDMRAAIGEGPLPLPSGGVAVWLLRGDTELVLGGPE